MKIALLLGLVSLTACQAPVTAAAPTVSQPATRQATAAPSTGHLWISVSTATHYPSIERFKLVNGVPQATPDLVYNGYGGLLAVAGDGTLYASAPDYGNGVVAFPPNADQPSRTITIPEHRVCGRGSGGYSGVSSLAADAGGYLFAGIYTTGTAAPVRGSHRGKHKSPRLCEDVAVYSPTADGEAIPIQLIHFPKPHWLMGLAVDASDNLFVDDSTYEVDEFVNALSKPKKTRVFKGGYVGYAHSIATDGTGNLYIASTDASYKTGRIERYAPDADGSGPPTSTIVLPSGVYLLETIAERGRVVYVDGQDKGVDLYHAHKNGNQSPFYSFTASNVISMATGP